MAKLPQETITTIFNLQRRLLERIDEATATEAMIYTRRRSVEKLREVCRQYDALNLLLNEALASVEADIRNSPLTAYRLQIAKRVAVEERAE